jgi:hypothetical protein
MPTADETDSIAEELDAMHRKAMEHFRAKDVSSYVKLFAADLIYRQANGVEIGRDQLARDVAAQLSRIESSDTTYKRESLRIEGDHVVEQLVQTASATVRVFLFFRRTWQVRRTGRYSWAKSSDGWKIQRVEVLDERVTSGAA